MVVLSGLCSASRAALLTGRGHFIDDLPAPPATLAAAILRSPHAHAEIRAIDVNAARALPGVAAVLVGADLAAITKPLPAVLRVPIECRVLAVDRVRYVGEPVAIVVAGCECESRLGQRPCGRDLLLRQREVDPIGRQFGRGRPSRQSGKSQCRSVKSAAASSIWPAASSTSASPGAIRMG